MSSRNGDGTMFARPLGANVMVGRYDGADLARAPARPASRSEIPSRWGDELRYRDGRVTDLQGAPIAVQARAAPPMQPIPLPAPPPQQTAAPIRPPITRWPAPASTTESTMPKTYAPEASSFPGRVIATLQIREAMRRNSYMTLTEIEATIGAKRTSFGALFGRAIAAGLLRKIKVDGQAAVVLPTYDDHRPPAEQPEQAAATEISGDGRGAALPPAPASVYPVGTVEVPAMPGKIRSGFSAALWTDGELELFGLEIDGAGYCKLSQAQTAQLAAVLAGHDRLEA